MGTSEGIKEKVINSTEKESELLKTVPDSGENEEDKGVKIFSKEASLYRYVKAENSWKGRGKGEMNVILDKKTDKYRISLIREKVFKYGCNHYIQEITKLERYPISEHAWLWDAFGDDCGDGFDPTQTYLARFVKKEDSDDFQVAVQKGIDHLKNKKEEENMPREKKLEEENIKEKKLEGENTHKEKTSKSEEEKKDEKMNDEKKDENKDEKKKDEEKDGKKKDEKLEEPMK